MKKCFCCIFVVLLAFYLASCSTDIAMPYSSDEYRNGEWTADSLTEHFKELGFQNVKASSQASYFGDYSNEIISVEIETDTDSIFTEYICFEKGDVFSSSDEIYINYYYTPEALTIDNCPELAEFLFGSKDDEPMDYMAFAEKYDGRYVRFDACVSTYLWGAATVVHVVAGDDENSDGHSIHISNPSLGENFGEGISEGQLVKVYGKIDASYSKYFKMLDIRATAFEPR